MVDQDAMNIVASSPKEGYPVCAQQEKAKIEE
jgi:hypothetical protein